MMKQLIVVAFLASNILLNATSTSAQELTSSFVAVIVADMDVSLKWYTEVLGFEVSSEMESAQRGFKQVNLQKGENAIELLQLDGAVTVKDKDGKRARLQGFFKYGFTVPDFNLWIRHLKKHSVEFNGDVVKDPKTKKRVLVVFDPDKNRIQFFEK